MATKPDSPAHGKLIAFDAIVAIDGHDLNGRALSEVMVPGQQTATLTVLRPASGQAFDEARKRRDHDPPASASSERKKHGFFGFFGE